GRQPIAADRACRPWTHRQHDGIAVQPNRTERPQHAARRPAEEAAEGTVAVRRLRWLTDGNLRIEHRTRQGQLAAVHRKEEVLPGDDLIALAVALDPAVCIR